MMPAFASSPLVPVTTTLAMAESRMSCTFGSGGMKLFKRTIHPMQLGRIGAEQAQQMPEKQCAGSEREKKQIRHLRGQPGRVIHRGFPNQPARNAPNQSEIFHLRRSLLCRAQISIKVQMLSRVITLCVCPRS